MTVRYVHFLIVVIIVALLAACGQDDPAPTAEPPTPTEAVAQVEPSPTAAPPTATVEPSPTATPSATPTMTPTPTATSVLLLAPEDFGEDRNPLTGEVVEDPSLLERRPIAVKISNSPAEFVRPQSGLGQADLVFEAVTEGPITRFTAVIYGQSPETMGPIRSGRLIDVEIPAMYDAAFAYSGSSSGVAEKLFNSDFSNRILRPSAPGYYRTGEEKPFEHTLYGYPETWWEELDSRELNRAPNFSTQMAFSEEPPAGGEPAGHVNINYRDRMIVDWRFDEESGRYLRWADGEEHTDRLTDEQLSVANVIIVYAVHQVDYNICEFYYNDQCTAYSTEAQIWGQGPVWIVRDGQMYRGVWKREQRNHMLTFYDQDDNPLPLQIGNSFVQVVPLHYQDPVTVEP